MPSYKAFRWVQHIQNLTFSHKMSIKISYIFWCLILGLIFWDFGATWCQKARFWEPLGAQLGPKWRPKSPKWCQNAQKKYPGRSLFGRSGTNMLPGSLRSALDHHFGRFGMDVWWNLAKFSIILIQLSMHFWRPNLQTTKAAYLDDIDYSTQSAKRDHPQRTPTTIRGRRCSRRMAHSDNLRI